MRAYKMFNKDMTCTKGKGVFQYEVGKTYREDEANCARNGFHCAENPLDCLTYYRDFEEAVCCEVEARGCIDEDDRDSKISCTEIFIRRKISLEEFVVRSAMYIQEHPKMEKNWRVMKKPSKAGENHFVIVCCEKPAAKGKIGDIICCIKEEYFTWNGVKQTRISSIGVYKIDGKTYMPDTWYDCEGEEVIVNEES